ncbi:MAG: response regulator transcription factor [Burkholderiaceae bacterium]|nr:response regulator transcription factor [Burkholderiaceae bacterium]
MRILLVDDDAALGEMLSTYLSVEGFATKVVRNGREGVEAALADLYDVVILDIMMPGMNGIDALREIRRQSDVPIIMLTARGDNLDRVIGLEMGADDYVPKPCDLRELLARIRAVLRRRPSVNRVETNERFVLGGLELLPGKRKVLWQAESVELTVSEFNVLEVLIRARGLVKSKDDLYREALERRREPYDRSLDVHISNIRQKLANVGAAAIEIETVRGIGYRLKDDE